VSGATAQLVSTIDEVLKNVVTLDAYGKGNDRERQFHHRRIKNGKVFVAAKINGHYLFAPSKFAGYKDNDTRHANDLKARDGGITNGRFEKLLGPYRDKGSKGYGELDDAFLAYCRQHAIEPSKHHQARRYWLIDRSNQSESRRTSDRLQRGVIYPREALKEMFGITDATLNTGVFRPKGSDSIWLFVTERKTTDRTQYVDHLVGDVLNWQGQTSGRTDKLIVEHAERDLEILLFYRREKYEHAGAGFRYEGQFQYERHEGSHPASFVLHRMADPLEEAAASAEDEGAFDPTNLDDARGKTLAAIVRRRGQQAFRKALIEAYGGRCAITGCDLTDVLEAAHIHPYRGEKTNDVRNGLLLRADFHTLFDLGLIGIDPQTGAVLIRRTLQGTAYAQLAERILRQPQKAAHAPSKDALAWHRDKWKL
jgi:putative restriction endonuclease